MALFPIAKIKAHSLTGRITTPLLHAAFKAVKRNRGAAGIDRVSIKMFEANLAENLSALERDLKNGSFQPFPLRRHYIPKGESFRPLGIPAVRDRVAQEVLRRLLHPIFERLFHDASFGFRPGRNCHMALDRILELHDQGYRVVLDGDVKAFLDHLRHEELLQMLGKRIQDGALLGLIRKWLRAGILEEDGKVIHPVLGTPQGGIVSPVLANVYLHNVLDQWFEQEVRTKNRGQCRLFRFADDFVACFEYRHEAVAFEQALKERLATYGLEVAPEKTKTIRFGRNGGPPNGRFDFLGFEFRWEASRTGQPIVKRRTSRKKLQTSMRRFTEWIQKNRHQKIRKLMKTLAAKYQGYWNYYGLIGNSDSLGQFYWQTGKVLFKWLNRRSQKPSYTWRAFNRLLKRFGVPAPRIAENERKQLAIPCCWGWKLGQILARYLDLRPT